MSSNNGHIRLHRKLLEWEWWSDHNTARLWVHILLKANWKAGRFRGHDIPRGSFVGSSASLAKECALGRQSVRTALANLQSTGELTTKSTSRFTVYTVVKYEDYQGDCCELTSKSTSNQPANQPASNQHLTTIEESNKGRRKNISPRSSEDDPLPSAPLDSPPKLRKPPSDPRVNEIRDLCMAAYFGRYGKKFLWGARWAAQAKTFVAYLDSTHNGNAMKAGGEAIAAFFRDPDEFLVKTEHDLGLFFSKPHRWIPSNKPAGYPTGERKSAWTSLTPEN